MRHLLKILFVACALWTNAQESILEAGDTDDPMELYIKFRGHEPNADALLRNRGLKE